MDLGDPALRASGNPDSIETRADLARELTALRARSGLTIRALADRLGIPFATVGGYFSGRHLPGLAQLDSFCALLRACGVAEGAEAAWVDALARVRSASDGRVGRADPPYRGLEPFQIDDAELFFGREAATEDALGRLRRLRDQVRNGAASPLLLVVGPSGAGKSSLLRAGVAANARAGALDDDATAWAVEIITPGTAPAEALRAALSESAGAGRLVVIDQLEQVFAAADREQQSFFAELAGLGDPDTLIVAGMRTDFYEAAVREPVLLSSLRETQILVGPMTEQELRAAIVEPAHQAGVVVEDGLVDVLLADLAPGSPRGFAHEAGALPLLSYGLLMTWQRAQRNHLTLADYRAAGGLRGAVSQRAEELYGQLSPAEQELARRMLCRMVRVAGDEPATRRRLARRELEQLGSGEEAGERNGPQPAAVLDRFVGARLVTLDEGFAELSHEALLSAWPRLAHWLERDRGGLRLQHQLTDAAASWDEAGRDPALLLRGIRLQAGLEWAEEPSHREAPTRAEHEFLDASVALAEAERRATRRRTRRTQELAAAAVALALVAVVLAVVAFHARGSASKARNQALSREVAIEADTLEPTDPALAMQLALAAFRIAPTTQATSTLIDASASEMPTRLLGPTGPTAIAVGRSGAQLAVTHSATDAVQLYRLTAARPTLLSTVPAGPTTTALYALALSPDGRLLAAGGTDGQVTLWSLSSPRRPVRLATLDGAAGTVYGLAFSPDGRQLASAGSDGSVRDWSLATPSKPRVMAVLRAPGHASMQALSYSPDGAELAAAGAGGRLAVWRLGATPILSATRTLTASTLTTVAYSPDGQTLAVGSQDSHVYLLRAGSGGVLSSAHAPLRGFTSWVDSLTFSPDGRYLAAGDSDNSLRIWSTAGWAHVATLMHTAPVTGAAFTPGARRLVTADEDGTTRIWSFPPPAAVREPGNVYTVDYTADGSELAAVSGGPGGDVGLWNVRDPWRPAAISSVSVSASFGPVAGVEALSPDGRLLAVGNAQGTVRLLDLANPHHPRLVGPALTGATPSIEQLNFSPDMKLLSVGDNSGTIHLWDIARPSHPLALAPLTRGGGCGYVFGVDYSSDGKLLAAACSDHEVWLWDVAHPRRSKLLAVLSGFGSDAYTVAISPDGKTLIAGSADDTLRLWSIADPAHPKLLGTPLTGPTSVVYDVAVSPAGNTLAAATTSGQVWLWNISNPAHPRVRAVLTAATGQVFDVTFSPNGRTLVASGGDQTLHFWDYHPPQVAARICALAGDPITRSEWSQYIQGAAYNPPCR